MNQKQPPALYREACAYAHEALATASRHFRALAAKPPPPMRSSGSLVDLQKDGEVLDRYYDALIIHDPLRAVLIVPHHTVVEVDLDRINNAQDLLAWVLALSGKTPADWREKDWDSVCFVRTLVKRIGQIKGWTWVEDYLWLL